MTSVTETSIMIARLLRERPAMVIPKGPFNIEVIRAFLGGYTSGLHTALGFNVDRELSIWVGNKTNQGSSLVWTEQIALHYKERPEKELIGIMLQTFEDFFIENGQQFDKIM